MTEHGNRVLVTGATGFVGSAVVRELLRTGHDVLALVRTPSRAADLEAAGARPVTGDMLDPATYRRHVDDVDAVVHTAQYATGGRFTGSSAAQVRHADEVMTTALADACQAGGKRLVYTSGCFNYGDHGDGWIDEETPFTPSPLGVGHAALVTALRERHRTAGLDVVVISPGFVYGPGGMFRSAFFDQARQKRLRCIGAGRNFWSPVHRDDLARAYVAALRAAPAGREYNVVDDEPLRLRALVDAVTDGMGQRRVGTVPPFLMGLLIGRPLVDSLVTSFRIRNLRARDELDWSPAYPTFAAGLAPTLDELGAVVGAVPRG
jgi:nucleoside-diphosphate-sugar epimerase